jgi:uncharacterized SAM-binding protein YcdF (DUF218 family)
MIYTNPEEIPFEILLNIDVIIVLGGGAPTTIDEPPTYVQQRCDDAAKVLQLYNNNNNNQNNKVVLPVLALSAGTAHLPQLISTKNGLPIWESTSSVAYLHKVHSIPYNTMFVETTSYDTIGNAYFTRTCHTDINGWRKLLIITNKVNTNIKTKIFFFEFLIT